MTLEDRIRALAHRLWEEEGRPHGRHEDHWHRACREVGAPDLRATAGGAMAQAGAPAPSDNAHLVGADETNDGFPDAMGVDDLNVGRVSNPSDAWPSTGRSKLAGA